MSTKLYTHKVTMTVKSTSQNWLDVKRDVNTAMNCGIVNELTSIKDVRFIKPFDKKKGQKQ